MNFLMRAVAEPEGDYYFDKATGESDGEEYYERKEWSDLNRLADSVDKVVPIVNHTDISDIDGVVDILTKRPPSPILEAINNARLLKEKERRTEPLENEEDIFSITEKSSTQMPTTAPPEVEEKLEQIIEEKKKAKAINNEEEDDSEDYGQETSEKPTSKSEEEKANEEKKAKILSSVDELKERHAIEQRRLSQRIKAEDGYKDESSKIIRDMSSEVRQGSSEEIENPQRHRRIKGRKPTMKPDYDEYEDLNVSLEDKYKLKAYKTDLTEQPRRTTTPKIKERKGTQIEFGKQSVFKNPGLFMIYDDTDETTMYPTMMTNIKGQQKFSSRYTTPSSNTDHRISLVPAESKEGEPTLFFPKTRKNKKRRFTTTTSDPTDSFVAETVTDNYSQTTEFDVTAADSVLSDTTAADTAPTGTDQYTDTTATDGISTDTTASDAESTNSDAVTDAVAASTEQKKRENEEYHNEKGGGKEHHSDYSEEHEELGKKAYEGHHEKTKAAKGHHDKENHLGKYDDHGGVDKHHGEESGHYGDHHHEEHGKKHAKYEESGKHSKGHSTKGSHDVHKKEEYEKNVEFFEEEGDSGDMETHGGYNHETEHSQGGRFKKGNLNAAHDHHAKGESGHFEKGGHAHGYKGHHHAHGHDGHGRRGQHHFQKDGVDSGKKWIYHHGSPAKTANLIVIDRRGDQFYHGPHYYG